MDLLPNLTYDSVIEDSQGIRSPCTEGLLSELKFFAGAKYRKMVMKGLLLAHATTVLSPQKVQHRIDRFHDGVVEPRGQLARIAL